MRVDYDHSQNLHSLEGPRSALPRLFEDGMPRSILDVGCGRGTWLRAAVELGVTDVFGIDGVDIPPEQLLFNPKLFRNSNLTVPVDLGRLFDVVLCLEVAEHLDEKSAPVLVQTLTKHSDNVIFSAACPRQSGQNHVNCQWPSYWQGLFNKHGFVCTDVVRWKLWGDTRVEPWYRQNMFAARRDPLAAGEEARIPAVIHPSLLKSFEAGNREAAHMALRNSIETGCMPVAWYFTTILSATFAKLRRRAWRDA